MQTIDTLDQAAAALQDEFPHAHVNVISDTEIEVYIGQPEDAMFIEHEVTDEDDPDPETLGWLTREGWGDATYPGTIHRSEIGVTWDSLTEAVTEAIRYLRNPTR